MPAFEHHKHLLAISQLINYKFLMTDICNNSCTHTYPDKSRWHWE